MSLYSWFCLILLLERESFLPINKLLFLCQRSKLMFWYEDDVEVFGFMSINKARKAIYYI
jgi:hypothetical protein